MSTRKEIVFDDGAEAVVYSKRAFADAKLPLKVTFDLVRALRVIPVKETNEVILITKYGAVK